MTDPCDAVEEQLKAALERAETGLPVVNVDSDEDAPDTRIVAMVDGASEDDKRPGRWLLDCRVDVIMEAEAGNSPEALAAVCGKVLGWLRDSALPDMLSGPRARVFGAQDFDIARSRTRHEWMRTLKFKVWAAALDVN
ncbi:MAG TPA: hypothetical protein PLU30_06065 [Verrucomicrobiae bacterium]|nr:hypothetical protein [Verrucomicrobiae bacterium]